MALHKSEIVDLMVSVEISFIRRRTKVQNTPIQLQTLIEVPIRNKNQEQASKCVF